MKLNINKLTQLEGWFEKFEFANEIPRQLCL